MKRILSLFLITIISCAIFAVDTDTTRVSSIQGLVIDKDTKEPLPGANIVILNEKQGAATDLDGKFNIFNVDIGYYQVKISMVGYKPIIKNRVDVKPGRPTVINVELQEDISTTEVIIVKPSYFEEVEDAPLSSRTMDIQEIIAQPGASNDVQRAMQAFPAVVSGSDYDNEIIVRGGNIGENQFLLDNIELANPNHYAFQGTGGGPFSILNTDFIEQVDFYAGAFPARFGGKTSSILDMKMREGLRDGIHFKMDNSAMGIGGNVEGPLVTKDGSFMLSYHKSLFSLLDLVMDLPIVPDYWNVQGKFVYDFSPKLKLSTFALYADDKFKVNDEDQDSETAQDFEYNTNQYTLGMNLKKVTNNGYLNLTAFRSTNNWHNGYTDSTGLEIFHNNSTELTNAVKARYNLFLSKQDEINIGAYIKYSEFKYDFYMYPDTVYVYEPGTDSILDIYAIVPSFELDRSYNARSFGGYGQYRHSFGALLNTTIGLRYEGFDYRDYTSYYLSPRFSATYNITAETDVSVALGRHYQQPQWYQLASNDSLEHYYTDQIVVGTSHMFREDIRGSIEIYYKKYNDMPIERSSTTEDPYDNDYTFINYQKGYAKGIEFFLQKKVKDNLWGTISYSLSEAKDEDPREKFWTGTGDNPYDDYSKSFDYKHSLTTTLGYHHEFKDKQWYKNLEDKTWFKFVRWIPGVPADVNEYSIRFKYMGGQPYTKMTYHPELRDWWVEPGTPYNTERLPAYARLDLRIQSRWYKGKMSISSYFELNNALDRNNILGYSYEEDGTIEELSQFPMMPSVGIIFEF